jgi:hypothetical protein
MPELEALPEAEVLDSAHSRHRVGLERQRLRDVAARETSARVPRTVRAGLRTNAHRCQGNRILIFGI